MKYKCIRPCYHKGNYIMKPDDIITIEGSNVHNITTGGTYCGVGNIVESYLEAITDDMNYNTTFESITKQMLDIYTKKNHDYGNSFDESLNKFGLIASVVRLGDKMNRLESLINKEAKVNESIVDTLTDLANYSIMTIMWLKNGGK